MKIRRNTKQKNTILDALTRLNCHASAGMVYEEVHRDFPTISRATVFRVLSDAAEDGQLLRIHFADGDDRFDITTAPHDHITCRRCGFVADIALCGLPNPVSTVCDSSGFTVEGHHLEFTGLCPSCAAAEERGEPRPLNETAERKSV